MVSTENYISYMKGRDSFNIIEENIYKTLASEKKL